MVRGKRSKNPSRKAGAAADVPLVKMSALAKQAGVPTPTIKHYIREGLLPGPVIRTSRNMAYYDGRVVERVRVIKQLQAEQYLPLRALAELLEPSPSAKLKRRSERQTMMSLAPVVAPKQAVRRRRAEIIQTAPLTSRELSELERDGVLELQGEGATAGYSGPDLEIVELVIELRRLGYGDVFPLSIGKVYLAAVRRLLDAEIEVFRRHALAATLPAPLPDVAKKAVELGERLVIALRAKLMPAALLRVPERT